MLLICKSFLPQIYKMFKNVSVFSNLIRLLSFLSHLTSLHFFSFTLSSLILIFNLSSFIKSSFLNHCYLPFLKPYHFLTKIFFRFFFVVLVLNFFSYFSQQNLFRSLPLGPVSAYFFVSCAKYSVKFSILSNSFTSR